MQRNLLNKVALTLIRAPAAVTADVNLTSKDVRGLRNLAFLVSVGAFSTFDGSNKILSLIHI